jgi:hypothetical protein
MTGVYVVGQIIRLNEQKGRQSFGIRNFPPIFGRLFVNGLDIEPWRYGGIFHAALWRTLHIASLHFSGGDIRNLMDIL